MKTCYREKQKSILANWKTAAARMYPMIDGVVLYSSIGVGEEAPGKIDLADLLRHVEIESCMVKVVGTLSGEPLITGSYNY